ncbi:uncharacterized protein (DUF885 family) [Chryseobacterium sp. SORGH_AS909]|nr:uncharacterized protein (DUF885 family) [Chryseobacterium sp. SORGH_AS_0909]
MKNIILKSILSLGLLAGITACRKSDSPLTKVTPSNLDSIASNYYEQYLKLYPLDATSQGDTRYNDQLPINIDKDFISGEVAFYSSVQKQLENVDYEKLSDESKTVYDVLDYTLQDKIEAYAYHPEYIPFTQFSGLPLTFPLYGSGQGPQPFKTTQDYDNWLKRMEKFPEWMNAATENFREGINSKMVLPKKLVIKMIPQMRAPEIISIDLKTNIFYGPINNFPKGFTKAQKDQYTTLYKESVTKNIIPAYTRMGDFLEKEYLPKARDTDGYNSLPNGNDIYRYYVKSWTTTKYTPEEINKTGLQQVAMLRAEMEKVKQQVGFKGTLEEFISYVKTDPKAMPYKTSKEVLDAFNAILTKITPKLKTMFSVTPKTKFEIRQTEKFREASASAEYIQGTADGKRPGIFYVPLPDPSKFNVTSGMESLFLHEAIPGQPLPGFSSAGKHQTSQVHAIWLVRCLWRRLGALLRNFRA